jgi:hypothetical protein
LNKPIKAGTPSGDRGTPAAAPPAGVLPVSVPANMTLVRQDRMFARVTSIVSFPTGFLFFLVIGFDAGSVPFRTVEFYAPRERSYPLPARLRVSFADGRAADSAADPRIPEDAVMRYRGGDSRPGEPATLSQAPFRRHETCWWVSPLPPPGNLDFLIYLRDSAEPAGVGRIDAGSIRDAASRSAAHWGVNGDTQQ